MPDYAGELNDLDEEVERLRSLVVGLIDAGEGLRLAMDPLVDPTTDPASADQSNAAVHAWIAVLGRAARSG